MRKAYTLLILGLWTVILPYLGFPSSWKEVLFSITGLGIIYFSFILYKEAKVKEMTETGEQVFDNFRENTSFGEKEI